MAERKGVALEMSEMAGLPVLCADPDALEKVLVNLLGNALKFTDDGTISVGARETEEGGIHLTIADTGVGIPPEQLVKVFDRFAQVDGSATRRFEGTGIGLSLVQELVRLHGGKVWAESEGEGCGTCMHVVLPPGEADARSEEEVLLNAQGGVRRLGDAGALRAVASDLVPASERTASPSSAERYAEMEESVRRWEAALETGADEGDALQALPAHPAGTAEVVIAEDNPEMRSLLAFLIGREFAVRPQPNGRAALAAVRERSPQLVVTDVMMPEMTGTELCRALKEDAATRDVPVMLVTSKAEREMKIEGLELGADDYVTKPFHPRELMARVRSLVRVRELQEEVAEQNASLVQSNGELATALKELQEAEVQLVQAERLAAVGELSAGVAHEVNNPLNFARNSLATLRTYVQDIRQVAEQVARLDAVDAGVLAQQVRDLEGKKGELHFDEMADDLTELISIVTEGLDRTARLVAELRDFAAPHRGELAPVDVVSSLSSTLDLMGYRLREVGAQLEWVPPRGDLRVSGDAAALNQVFLNLLKNAADAFEGNGGAIQVTAVREGREVVVRIQDDGPGMTAEVRERLFEPFFTTKQAGAGTGLGLSMSKRIVEQHGGRIEVDSEPGRGAQVTLRLPAEGCGSPVSVVEEVTSDGTA